MSSVECVFPLCNFDTSHHDSKIILGTLRSVDDKTFLRILFLVLVRADAGLLFFLLWKLFYCFLFQLRAIIG